MNTNRRHAVAALIAAGLLWGTTVPLSKLALAWLSPGWLTAVRFGLAAAVLLAAARRRGQGKALRRAFRPAVLAAGALGYGGSVLVQNAGISRTSVTHAALLIGAVPVLVAVIAAAWQRTVARPVAWVGFAVSLGGVALVTAGSGGGGATPAGDGLVLASLVLSATLTVAQGRLLAGRDPVAVTAVQFLGAALGALPVAALTERAPAAPGGAGPVLAVAGLALGGTLLAFTLFAFGQSRVSAEVAGAFFNLEPLVGAITGAVAFGDPAGPAQVAGGAAILAGIALSSLPLLATRRTAPHQPAAAAGPLAAAASQPQAPALPARNGTAINHHRADDSPPRIEKLVRWTCPERIRFRWYLLRLTVREMNYATRRMTELHTRPVTSRHQQRTPGDDQARDPSCIGTTDRRSPQPGRPSPRPATSTPTKTPGGTTRTRSTPACSVIATPSPSTWTPSRPRPGRPRQPSGAPPATAAAVAIIVSGWASPGRQSWPWRRSPESSSSSSRRTAAPLTSR